MSIFEPELTLRQLRDRLYLINRLWPSYSNGVGIILGDFNICDPEEGRFNVCNQTFTDGDPRMTAMFHSCFHMFLRLLNLITRGGTPQPLGSSALCQGLIVFFNLPFTEARDFHCYSHVFENLGNRTIPSDHAAVRLVKGQQIEDSRAHVFLAACPNIPFSVPFCNGFTMITGFLLIRLVAEFKVLLKKAKRLTIRELSRKTPDSIVAKLLIASAALRAYRN